jgi:hypothetical protein
MFPTVDLPVVFSIFWGYGEADAQLCHEESYLYSLAEIEAPI